MRFFMTAGQVSVHTGARAMPSSFPKAKWLLGDRGYDADWFREDLKNKGMKVCIPGRNGRKTTGLYDRRCDKRRNRLEIMFGRHKNWCLPNMISIRLRFR
ncbi:transposase [Rhodovulum sulfidophilum]|uniref:Transposase n=1 Tax=Rhodovulum sulfidophilum TaxID=35806 RepID=A0A0D6B7L2_RHOSU|nr:transposase [Rhodovulum sulfidophilum]BAQ71316.1 transposase [Rhodovulum sulfidophilum]